MKTISVSNCGECPFLNHDQEALHICESDCNAWPEPTQKWNCLAKTVPAECPLRVDVISVQVKL